MKRFLTLGLLAGLLATSSAVSSAQSIATARAQGAGATVTVRGIVTSGAEFNGATGAGIRYLQDGTAGLGAYFSSGQLGNLPINRGDSIEVTGPLIEFNNLLEISPVTAVSVITTGNPVPAPIVLTLPGAWAEAYEGRLVRINALDVVQTGNFAGNTNYDATNGAATREFRVGVGTNIVGSAIPSGTNLSLIGVMSQFSSANPSTGYQLLPRDLNDVNVGGGPIFLSRLMAKNITTTGLDVAFSTNVGTTAVVEYGTTSTLGSTANATVSTTNHSINLSGLTPATVYYVKVTVTGGGQSTVSNGVRMVTASLSSGNIITYFNRPVNNAIAAPSSNLAVYLNESIDDTLIAYINRAQESIDFAVYNINNAGLSDMTAALNAAYARGVDVRVVYDGNTANIGISNLNVAIGKIASPISSQFTYGIMHNKFLIIDAESTNPNKPLVWTGSTNFTDAQINIDPNNVIIIQDQALARSYKVEFEEMFGSTGLTPGAGKFGPDKTDNTPHDLLIAGQQTELFFSPTDNVQAEIVNAIGTAQADVEFALLEMTRTAYSNAIRDQYFDFPSMFIGGVEDDTTTTTALPFRNLKQLVPSQFFLWQDAVPALPGQMHHKYCIIDQNNASSDPQVITGSHNWSGNAADRNDENTLIVHSASVANRYMQEWAARYIAAGGTTFVSRIENTPTLQGMLSPWFPNPADQSTQALLHSTQGGEVALMLVDAMGRVVLRSTQVVAPGSTTLSLPTASLTAGVYQLVATVNGATETRAISVQR